MPLSIIPVEIDQHVISRQGLYKTRQNWYNINMIILDFENWNVPGVKKIKLGLGETAQMVLFVIDEEVVEIMGVSPEITSKLTSATNFEECSTAVAIPDVFCVSFNCDTEKERIIVDERMYSILLSNPQIIKGDKLVHRHIEKVALNWLYKDGQFIIPGVYE